MTEGEFYRMSCSDWGVYQVLYRAGFFTKRTVRVGEILWGFLFVALLSPNMAHPFNSNPSGEFYHKTLTQRGLKNITVALQSTDPIKRIGFSETAVQEIQKSVQSLAKGNTSVIRAQNRIKDKESPCDNEHLLACRERIRQFREMIVATLAQQPLPGNVGPMVWSVFGEALYRMQNFYSHSNWIYAAVAPTCQPKVGESFGDQESTGDPNPDNRLRESICAEIPAQSKPCLENCDGTECGDRPESNCQESNGDSPDKLKNQPKEGPLTVASLSINAAAEFVNQIVVEMMDRQEMNQGQRDQALCAFMGAHACTAPLPILPGMAGGGSKTPAGSGPNRTGGKVFHVTNLSASGPGSLRYALESSGPRIVVFDVSGYIQLTSMIEIHEPYVTIAGQTAPYPGITLKGGGIRIRTHDVLVQHIRIRPGDDPVGPEPASRDALSIGNKHEELFNIVVDHVSLSWGIDENMDIWYPGHHDITLRNSILSEALNDSLHPEGTHSKGFLVGYGTKNLLVIGNLFAHNDQRNLRALGDTSTLFVNNLVYNWYGSGRAGAATGYSGEGGALDASIVGNVYIRGPNTRKGGRSYPVHFRDDVFEGTKVYVEDNLSFHTSSDPWSVVKNDATVPIRVDTWPNEVPYLKVKKGQVVRDWVLGNAGARRADTDPVDLRILNDVKNRTGRIIDSQNDVGGWPPLVSRVRGVDGIPALSVPSQEIQASGYTKLEEWLHQLAQQVEVPNWGPSN